jgi:subtilase family serine protease
MRPRLIIYCGILLAIISVSLIAQKTSGQSSAVRPLITQPVDETKLLVLKGNTYPLARAAYDRGPVSTSLPMNRMILVLKDSPEQTAELQTLLAQQADKTSPNYHKWLTPQEFGQRFGASQEDLQKITTWLQSHGFQSIKVANGRNVIEFSGTAGQVEATFHIAIHNYMVRGQLHYANASDPAIPRALAPAVKGVLALHNFGRKRMSRYAGLFRKTPDSSKAIRTDPQITYAGNCDTQNGDCYALGPTDFATIYNVSSLWNAGITGSGVKIAIVSDSNINVSDINQFRSLFGLPSNPPVVTVNGTDPGVQPCANNGDECEAVIDTEWSGAVAKNATINLVVSSSVDNTTFGGDLSAEYIIDNNVAPILSYSYGECELGLGDAGNAFYGGSPVSKDSVGEWAQAAAEGITVIVATGDTGSAGCDTDDTGVTTEQPAMFGLAVNGVSSTPYNVAVGGTDFNQLGNSSTYWNSSNASGTYASAVGYIPETTWNDSCTNAQLGTYFQGFSTNPETNCNNQSSPEFTELIAPAGGNGGASTCTSSDGEHPSSCSGGYAKPSWQTGTGVPADGKRDVPDVSLFAGDGFAGSFYAVCEEDLANNEACSLNDFAGFGGTSVSTQVFAGVVALVNQQAQSSQANFNTTLYPLAAQQSASSCNTSSPGNACVFYDVTVGTNAQPCEYGVSPNCNRTNSSDANGILTGFSASTGFDEATGLGSLNVGNLVNNFASGFTVSSASPTVTVSAPGNSGTMSATVTAKNGFSGNVTFSCSGLPTGATCSFNPSTATLSSTTTTATTTVTVNTTAGSAAAPASRRAAPGSFSMVAVITFIGILGAVIFALSMQKGSRVRSGAIFALLVLGLAGVVTMTSCGGGGGGGGGGNGGTPTGSTTATIIASGGGTSSSLSITVDVQ